jgi:hypothetical protein
VGRRGFGQQNVVASVAADAVLALLEPEQAADRKPATVGLESGFAPLPPLFDLLAIARVDGFSHNSNRFQRQ